MSANESDDVLADVLSMTSLGNSISCQQEIRSPWGMRFSPGPRVNFHYVIRGASWLQTADEKPIALLQGDLALLPHGLGHTLTDAPDTPVEPYGEVLKRAATEFDSGDEAPANRTTRLLCGTYRFEEMDRHPLLTLLPEAIILRADQAESNPPVRELLQLLMRELGMRGPGSAAVISRFVDVLFVYVVRAWLATQPDGTAGWLGALRDPAISAALSLMHAAPATPWTVATLAGESGMSRAAFALRFANLVGEAPLSYLRSWRMGLAAKILRETEEPVYIVARNVGYGSETAFSHAFRRARGHAPGRYRKEHRIAAYHRTREPDTVSGLK